MTWIEKAACRGIAHNPDFNPDEDPFYDPPEREDGGDKWEYARALCGGCPVRSACLDDALRLEHKGQAREGFRGGLTSHQRRRVSLGLPAVAKRGRSGPRTTTPSTRKQSLNANQASTKAAARKREEWVENIVDLLDLGLTGTQVLHRLSRRADGVHRRLERAGRLDVWERLGVPQTYNPRKAS